LLYALDRDTLKFHAPLFADILVYPGGLWGKEVGGMIRGRGQGAGDRRLGLIRQLGLTKKFHFLRNKFYASIVCECVCVGFRVLECLNVLVLATLWGPWAYFSLLSVSTFRLRPFM